MSSSSSPKIPPRDTASPAADATGYLLLTIPHTTVKQIYDGSSMTLAKGELKLECVTMPIPKEIGHQTANPFSPSPADPAVPTHDFWLVLQVGTFEMPVVPGQQLIPTLEPTSEGIVYTVPSPSVPNAFLSITMPRPASAADMEDLDSFETLLRQYKSLGVEATALANVTVPPIGSAARNNRYDQEGDEDYRGKLVLINEDSGEVIGQLDQELSVEDGQRLAKDDQNRPVILDFGHVIDGYAPSVKVQRVPEAEMDDWMLKSAHHLSRGILSVGSFTSKMMQSGASLYIKHATPNAEPTKLSPMAKANIRRVHNGSVRTVNVTKTTVGMINNAIMNVLDKTVGARVIEPAVRTYDDFSSSRKASMSSEGEKSGFWPPSPGGLGRKPPPPPVPPKTGKAASLVIGNQGQPPSSISAVTPGRAPSPLKIDTTSAVTGDARQPDNETWFEKGEMEHLLGQPPAYTSEPQQTSASPSGQSTPSSAQKAKRPWLGRLVLAGEVVLTSLEHTAHELINSGTSAASSAAGHKFGAEVGHATALLGGSVRNVAVVYIDVRGVGRRALLKSTAKGFVKARLKNGSEIRLQGEGRDANGVEVDIGEIEQGDKGQIVVGMPEVRKREDVSAPRAGQRSVTASGYPVDKKLE